ncbi:GNAT family N-acetyltransferase [Brevibacillus ruminantium]|uniref:GNAT family N-acetyltransferase n=1 Tax=Brevibacillus ruminantium TaxID=2950604 RepID=A0ABY4WJD6_9BACL|nr:GNAT family N-acetyltransferase [Brevibacillus ruminantium]USG67143.1 GNAT family N-acetyltransferase [Brevibacillus ruminantium]
MGKNSAAPEVDVERAKRVLTRMESRLTCPSHQPDYILIDATREGGLTPAFFIYEEQQDVFYHAFLMGAVPGTDLYDVQTPYGYGGALATTTSPSFLARSWAAYHEWCRENRILAELVRFHPLLENWRLYPGEVTLNRETVAIDLTGDDLFAQYLTRGRRKVRKAWRQGFTVEWTDHAEFFSYFPRLYNQLMEDLEAASFYFFPDSYYQAWERFANAHYALCRWEGQVVAAAFFYRNAEILEYHLSAASAAGKEWGATSLLIHEAARLGKEYGCRYLHLGGGTDPSPENPLFFFKSGFSGQRGKFYLGKTIFLPERYEELRCDWRMKNGAEPNRVLFYR